LPGHADVRVIAMSGYITPDIETEMLAAGAECCMAKPVDVSRLLQIMHLEA